MIRLIAIIALLPLLVVGCTVLDSFIYPAPKYDKEIEVVDAFCTNSEDSHFYFSFTLQNLTEESISISYDWTLNDPLADNPGAHEGINDPVARIYEGRGVGLLAPSEKSEIRIEVEETREYDPRFYVMYVSVYRDNELVGYYRGQKSAYDWDYSVTPPVRIK